MGSIAFFTIAICSCTLAIGGGCSGPQFHAYDGAPRPVSEVAEIVPGEISLVKVDGAAVQRPARLTNWSGIPPTYYVLPGKHQLEFGSEPDYIAFVKLNAQLKAGHRYGLTHTFVNGASFMQQQYELIDMESRETVSTWGP